MIEADRDRCEFCGACVSVCPVDAIELPEARIEIRPDRCIDCGFCVWVCPVEALKADGVHAR